MTRLPPGVRVLDGVGALAAVGPHYDDLLRDGLGGPAPLTARWHWLSTWARTHPDHRPLVVVVDGDGRPDGVALLVRHRRGPLLDVTALGHGQSDYARFPARTPHVATLLADGIAAAIRGLPGPRRVRLDGFAVPDPVLERLADRLPHARLLNGDGAPVIPLVAGADPLEGRREARVMARRGHNRLRTDGRTLKLEVATDGAGVAALLPELERLHLARDHAVRGFSDLDDPANHAFWSAVCVEAADRGELELSTMRVDGALAAYLLAFRDGNSYRVWDPRISPEHARYNPGHVLRADVLSRVAAAGPFTEFDWMRGVERYKLATTSTVVPTRRLIAWWPGWVLDAEPALRRGHARVTTLVRRDRASPAAAPAGPAPNSTLPAAPPRSGVLAGLVDGLVREPVLVAGSLPPGGRDLDLITGGVDAAALPGALAAAGFAPDPPRGWLRWVRADGRLRADSVELFGAADWVRDGAEQRWLWTTRLPLPGHRHLHRPAPAATLLLLAVRYAGSGGVLPSRWTGRIAAAEREDPDAWATAAAHAPAWGLATTVRLLRAHAQGDPPSAADRHALDRERRPRSTWLRRLAARGAPRRRRPAVVALSGLDGAGKTSQAALLVSALADLGVHAAPAWSRLSYRTWLWTLDRAVTGLVRLVRRARPVPDRAGPDSPRPHRALRQRHPALTWAWAWVIALDAVTAQRRALRAHRGLDVVVCDRYVLDSVVHLQDAYGATVDVRRHCAAVRALVPRPLAAFLLRLDPAAAAARKPGEHTVEQLDRHARLYDRYARDDATVTVLDAADPPLEIAERIAERVRAARA